MSAKVTKPRTVEQLRAQGEWRLADCEDPSEHSVYRCYDAAGQLLYIGCARNVQDRMLMHRAWSTPSPTSWVIRRRMARWTEERYPNREAARAAERAAIAAEMPLLNKQHNPRYRKNVRELPIVAT